MAAYPQQMRPKPPNERQAAKLIALSASGRLAVRAFGWFLTTPGRLSQNSLRESDWRGRRILLGKSCRKSNHQRLLCNTTPKTMILKELFRGSTTIKLAKTLADTML